MTLERLQRGLRNSYILIKSLTLICLFDGSYLKISHAFLNTVLQCYICLTAKLNDLSYKKSYLSLITVPLLQPSIVSKINGSCLQTLLLFFAFDEAFLTCVIWIVKKGTDFELCLTNVRSLSVGHMIEFSLLIIVFTCWKREKDTWIFVNQVKGPGDYYLLSFHFSV